MSGSAEPFEELGELLSALCDGEIAPEQAARLEQLAGESAQSRRFFLQYVQLHGELFWDHAVAASFGERGRPERIAEVRPAPAESHAPARAENPVKPSLPSGPGRRLPDRREPVIEPRARWGAKTPWVAAVLAASLLTALGWGAILALRHRGGGSQAAPIIVARLTGAIDADWSGSDSGVSEGAELTSGQTLELRRGLAEIAFPSGARAILDGPARLDLESTGRVFLHCGKLAAHVSPEAAGFTVATPSVSVVDLGTEFGVAVCSGEPTEIHVFAGSVQVQFQGEPLDGIAGRVQAGQAVRILPGEANAPPRVEQVASGSQSEQFVRALPPPDGPSVAALRRVVAQHPRLIHHYTFEGATQQERCQDRRGALHLTEAVMAGGRGGGAIRWSVPGFDATTNAVAPHRDSRSGNTSGVGLQSEVEFHPPFLMTVELLLRFSGSHGEGKIHGAVATRESDRRCGFLVAAVDQGHLTHLLDGDSPWVEGDEDFRFLPGEWYYLASTFRVEAGQTRINSYLANLSRGERKLTWTVKDRTASGVAPVSRLGIGKAFDAELAHAYPWAGDLDEVAVYDAVLTPATLQEHLRVIVGDDAATSGAGTREAKASPTDEPVR